MERMICKTCGCESMVPMQVMFEQKEDDITSLLGHDPESRFYTCHVCGDNWLTVKETSRSGAHTITFVHQMGTEPILKRVAHTHSEAMLNEKDSATWDYFMDDEVIDQEVWFDKLSARRRILKSPES